ncbi:hypothetical protein VCHENC02_4864, partial [Vibrio harveyi]
KHRSRLHSHTAYLRIH